MESGKECLAATYGDRQAARPSELHAGSDVRDTHAAKDHGRCLSIELFRSVILS
jgi:hypothetical protein